MHQLPALARYRLAYNVGAVQVAIPARRHWLVILFMSAWLCGWAMGEASAIAQLSSAKRLPPEGFLCVWLAMWTLAGCAVMVTILWQLVGRELLTISEDAIVHRVEIFGLGRTRSYATKLVSELRAVDFVSSFFSNQSAMKPPFFGDRIGPIAFDYGASSIRMAPSLDEAEARILVAQLRERLPARLFQGAA